MKSMLGSYFEIEEVHDISINVQKSLIKQRDRSQKFLATHSHVEIMCETARQL